MFIKICDLYRVYITTHLRENLSAIFVDDSRAEHPVKRKRIKGRCVCGKMKSECENYECTFRVTIP